MSKPRKPKKPAKPSRKVPQTKLPKAKVPVPAQQTMRGRERARLEKQRQELQKEYQSLRRYLRSHGELAVINFNQGELDKRKLTSMESAGMTYQDIKFQYQQVSANLQQARERAAQIRKDARAKVITEHQIHEPGSLAEQLLNMAGIENKPYKQPVSKKLYRELEQVVNEVNQRIQRDSAQTPVLAKIAPEKYDIEKVRAELTDDASYRREINRLRKAYLEDADWWIAHGTMDAGIMTEGEFRYLQSRIDEENKRRKESRKFIREQEERGRLMTQQEHATKPIDTSVMDAAHIRKQAYLYSDAMNMRRAIIWKNNVMRSISMARDAALSSSGIGPEDRKEIDEAANKMLARLVLLHTEQEIRHLSLYGNETKIFEGKYADIPSVLAYILNFGKAMDELGLYVEDDKE